MAVNFNLFRAAAANHEFFALWSTPMAKGNSTERSLVESATAAGRETVADRTRCIRTADNDYRDRAASFRRQFGNDHLGSGRRHTFTKAMPESTRFGTCLTVPCVFSSS